MTKGEAKKLYLRWLDEATVCGQEAGRELTADLEDRFDYFLEGTLFYLAGHFKLPAVYEGPAVAQAGPYDRYRMPEDFRELDRIVETGGGAYRQILDYRVEGERDFLVERGATPRFLYWKNPAALGPAAAQDTVLEVHPRAAILVPLKTAADATAGSADMAATSDYLEGIFSNMLLNLSVQEKPGLPPIETIYGQG
ncbi:MAG: hypothetical protein PHD67_01395 [Oscillospiraceae bacterium]|nr:hypothetical protein [Oscillospiraceae bacterium]